MAALSGMITGSNKYVEKNLFLSVVLAKKFNFEIIFFFSVVEVIYALFSSAENAAWGRPGMRGGSWRQIRTGVKNSSSSRGSRRKTGESKRRTKESRRKRTRERRRRKRERRRRTRGRHQYGPAADSDNSDQLGLNDGRTQREDC